MMMFTRLGRSISQSYRSRNVFGGGNGGRSQTLTRSSVYQSRYIRQAEDKLGVLKRYFGSLASNNGRNGYGVSSKVYISDINSILTIPRFFSSEAPKKEYDDNFHSIETPIGNNQKSESKDDVKFYSKKKKQTPQGNNQKSKSEEESSTKDDDQLGLLLFFCFLVIVLSPLIGLGLLFFSLFPEKNEIFFYEFEHDFLKRGLVDFIVIVNKSVAEVYVKNVQSTDGSIKDINSREKYHIKIRHFETFEAQLKESLGENSRVPVWYTSK